MRESLYVPWEDEHGNVAWHVERIADSLSKRTRYTSEQIREGIYRLLGWMYEEGVARRLREYPVHPAVGGKGDSPLRALAMLSGLLDATGLRQDEPARLYGRLADLIDPTCEEVRDE